MVCVPSCKPILIVIAQQRYVIDFFFFFAVEFSSFLSISGAKGGVHGDYLHSLLNKSWLGCDFFFLIASSVLTHF